MLLSANLLQMFFHLPFQKKKMETVCICYIGRIRIDVLFLDFLSRFLNIFLQTNTSNTVWRIIVSAPGAVTSRISVNLTSTKQIFYSFCMAIGYELVLAIIPCTAFGHHSMHCFWPSFHALFFF